MLGSRRTSDRNMPDKSSGYNSPTDPETNRESRPSGRVWVVWIAVFVGIILLMLFREGMDIKAEPMNQHKFEELVDAGRIVRATISYQTQSILNEVVGTYQSQNDAKVEVPFRARVRLTSALENKLLRLPQFELREPNTALLSILWSVLPILVVAMLVWFFFIRQIRKTVRITPNPAELHARAVEQQNRFEKLLNKWEEQARRMDGVLDRLEGNSRK